MLAEHQDQIRAQLLHNFDDDSTSVVKSPWEESIRKSFVETPSSRHSFFDHQRVIAFEINSESSDKINQLQTEINELRAVVSSLTAETFGDVPVALSASPSDIDSLSAFLSSTENITFAELPEE